MKNLSVRTTSVLTYEEELPKINDVMCSLWTDEAVNSFCQFDDDARTWRILQDVIFKFHVVKDDL